jgi:hypothetical protein
LSLLLFFSLCTISKASESEDARVVPSSTLVEGSWEVNGAGTITFTYKGQGKHHKVKHRSVPFGTQETWTFNPDGTFTTIDHGIIIDGSWREKGKNVHVYFNIPEYQALLEEALAADNYPVIFSGIKVSATGTVNTSTLKGKLTIKSHAYLVNDGVGGTVSATVRSVGSKLEPDAVVNADPESESLIAATSEVIRSGLSSPEE